MNPAELMSWPRSWKTLNWARRTASGAGLLEFLRSAVNEHGQTIVMVTHDPHAADHAETIVHLDKGVLGGIERKRPDGPQGPEGPGARAAAVIGHGSGLTTHVILGSPVIESVDVIEIDAASNNGVEDVRRLRETVGFATMQSRYRVVILDEVGRGCRSLRARRSRRQHEQAQDADDETPPHARHGR